MVHWRLISQPTLPVSKSARSTSSAGVTTTIDTNSTALTVDRGIQLSGKTTARITGDSTGIILAGKVKIQNKAGGLLGANSTALNVPAMYVGSLASYITANSTGIKIGAKYISCNSTGNNIT